MTTIIKIGFTFAAQLAYLSEIPRDRDLFDTFGIDKISHLAKFYGSTSPVADKTFPRLVDAEGVRNEYKIFKEFVFLKRLEYETQAATDLVIAETNLSRVESLLKLGNLDSKRATLKHKK